MAWVGPSRGLPAETCQENWGSYCSCFQEMVCSASQLMASVPGAWYYKAGLAPVHASDCWHLYPCRVLGHCSLCWARQCMLVVWSSFLNKMIKRTENNIKLLSKYFCLGHQQPQKWHIRTEGNHAGPKSERLCHREDRYTTNKLPKDAVLIPPRPIWVKSWVTCSDLTSDPD